MILRSVSGLLVGIFAAALFSSCMYSRELSQSKRVVERGHPTLDIDRRFMIALGPRTLHSAGWVARRINEEEVFRAGSYLKSLDRVKVGIYDVDYYDDRSRGSHAAVVDFERNGWTLAVRAAEAKESVWILYRADRNATVRDIKIVVLSEKELVIARIEGQLNTLLEDLARDHSGFLDTFQ